MEIYKVQIATCLTNTNVSKTLCLTCGAIVGLSLGCFFKDSIKLNLRRLHLLEKNRFRTENQPPLLNEDFNLTEAKFKYTFKNITRIRLLRNDIFSPEIWIGELPWKIMLRPTKLCLESHVICSERFCSWSCCVHLELHLLGRTPRILAVDDELYESDSQNEYNRNMGQNIPWEELLDPGNQYIQDDSITFQITLKVEILEKISWSDKLYLKDERANSLVKKYKTNIDIIRKKMKQLSKRNEQLEKDIKLLKMYNNTHFL